MVQFKDWQARQHVQNMSHPSKENLEGTMHTYKYKYINKPYCNNQIYYINEGEILQ